MQKENEKMIENRKKVAFFVRQGQDTFLKDIVDELSKEYKVNKVIVTTNEDFKLIDKWMDWANICWFEWCDELIIYGSRLAIAKNRKIVCRMHSYEAFTRYPSQVNWDNVDKLILVAEHVQKYVTEKFHINKEKTVIIPNGVNTDKCVFTQKSPGFKVAYAGYINYKKGPMLLLHTFKAIYDKDNRYEFHVAGQYQDPRYFLYFQQMIKEFGLEKNFFFHGWQQDLDKWLEDKNYIVCTSVLESQNMSVMQAMAKGIKPVIHNFVEARGIYKKEYIWNTIDEAVGMITEKSYDSMGYRQFIEEKFSFKKQLEIISGMLIQLITEEKKIYGFNYKDYWTQRLDSRFNIEGVGYIGLGEIYNKFLYRNRIDILEGVLSKAFDKINNKKVLELGPGIGIFTEYFHNKGVKEYAAIDIVEKSIRELSSKYKNYHFTQGDISESHHFKSIYDLIFAADVLLHITNEDSYKKALINIFDHLDDQGICILIDPVSVIHKKSKSPHVVIRDREYIEEVLKSAGLELIGMFPTTYFMNYPFDNEVIGSNGKIALEAFHLICSLFSACSINNEEKQLIGEYLLYKDKQLISQNGLGLSEKVLILQKKAEKQRVSFDLKDIFDRNDIKENIRDVNERLNQKNITCPTLFNKINELLKQLEVEYE